VSSTYDTIVLGAGPGGSATAHYLALQGLKVLLLDKSDFPRDKTCGDALTPGALRVIDDIGLLDNLLQVGYRTNSMEISAPNGRSITAPIPKIPDSPGFALIVPRMTLDNAIRERALSSGATFKRMRVTTVEQKSNGVVVTGDRQSNTASFRAPLVVIATGASTKVLLQMGILKQLPPMMVAARAYFEDVSGLSDQTHFHFDGVPLPGYGWVFPVSETAANVGAGFFATDRTRYRMPATPRKAFDTFLNIPSIQAMLSYARQVGPVKGYPLRVDFATSPTFADRVVLVGEAAGLVNPLSGEGIDYALESGKVAAEHIVSMFATGDFSPSNLELYDQALRQRFQRLFVFCNRVRDVALNQFALNWLVRIATRRTDLRMLLLNIVLNNPDIAVDVSLRKILRAIVIPSPVN
jgi:geranylgeranyl reductase family protein